MQRGLVFALWSLGLFGCESAAERCTRAQRAAEAAWLIYEQELHADLEGARKTVAEAQDRLTGEVEKRLADAAEKVADSRYDRSDSAWMRAFTTARLSACRQDEDCEDLKRKSADAQDAIDVLTPRLEAAHAARTAAQGPADLAKQRADAVDDDFDYASMKRARETSAAALEACSE